MIPGTPSSFLDSACPGNLDGRLFPLASREWLRPEATASEQLRWYAVYTRSRHEKRIKEQLEGMSFESFLPLYEAVHRWKDRRVRVSLPVFPGYVFVRIALPELRRPVVRVPGVVNLVGRPGCPTPIEDQEIEALRVCFLCGHSLAPHPYLTVGRRVRVRSGPLADVEGILLRKKGKSRLILSVKLIGRSVAVEVDACDVAAIGS
jgi:transcription termination/antitermination protein NusG